MSKNFNKMGSAEWVAQVFSTPPVRSLKGPSRATQYHEFWSQNMSRLIGSPKLIARRHTYPPKKIPNQL